MLKKVQGALWLREHKNIYKSGPNIKYKSVLSIRKNCPQAILIDFLFLSFFLCSYLCDPDSWAASVSWDLPSTSPSEGQLQQSMWIATDSAVRGLWLWHQPHVLVFYYPGHLHWSQQLSYQRRIWAHPWRPDRGFKCGSRTCGDWHDHSGPLTTALWVLDEILLFNSSSK